MPLWGMEEETEEAPLWGMEEEEDLDWMGRLKQALEIPGFRLKEKPPLVEAVKGLFGAPSAETIPQFMGIQPAGALTTRVAPPTLPGFVKPTLRAPTEEERWTGPFAPPQIRAIEEEPPLVPSIMRAPMAEEMKDVYPSGILPGLKKPHAKPLFEDINKKIQAGLAKRGEDTATNAIKDVVGFIYNIPGFIGSIGPAAMDVLAQTRTPFETTEAIVEPIGKMAMETIVEPLTDLAWLAYYQTNPFEFEGEEEKYKEKIEKLQKFPASPVLAAVIGRGVFHQLKGIPKTKFATKLKQTTDYLKAKAQPKEVPETIFPKAIEPAGIPEGVIERTLGLEKPQRKVPVKAEMELAKEVKAKPVTEKPAKAEVKLSEAELKAEATEMLGEAQYVTKPHVVKGLGKARKGDVRVEYDPATTPEWYTRAGMTKREVLKGLKDISKEGSRADSYEANNLKWLVDKWHRMKGEVRPEPTTEVFGGDLATGDKVKIEGEWYTAKPSPETGEVRLVDGKDIKLDIFEKLPVEEVTKARVTEPTPAVPAELGRGEPSKIGLNKAEQDRIRADLKLDKLEPAKRKRFERSLGEAKERKLDENALDISDEVLKSKRPITDAEHAGMVIKSARLADEYNATIKEVSSLIERGETRAAQVERTRADVIIDQLDKLTDAARQGGREVGRALSIRRMMVNRETYDIAHVTQRARASKGAKLTATESAKLKKLTAENSTLEATLKEIEVKYEKLLGEKEKKIAQGIATREVRKTQITKRTATTKEKILSDRANIKKQLTEMGFRVNDIMGVTTEGAYLVGKLATTYIREGVTTLDGVVRKVLIDLPQLTERDVYRSLAMKNPKAQARAKIEVTQRVARLKSQARLLVEIENAEKGVFEPKRGRQVQSAEIKSLQKKLRGLRNAAYRSDIEATQLEKVITTINELQDQLANHRRTLRKGKKIDPPELVIAKEKLKEVRSAMRVEDELVRLNEQLRTGEFEVKPKPEPKVLPPELERKQVELKRARRQIQAAIDDMAPITARKIGVEAINTARTLKATADMSGTLRQGLILSVSRPIRAAKNFAKSVKATFSEYTAEQIDHAIRSADDYYLCEKAGLELTEVGAKIVRREEMFMARAIEKFPVIGEIVKASNRHMTTFLNLMRKDAFSQFLKKYSNATHLELKAWADAVNIFSGRGNLGRASAVASELSLITFAPRFAVSRIQTPYMFFKYIKMPRVRTEIAKDLVATATLGGTLLTLADLAGFEVGLNPRDPDWGKIRIGDTRIDVWGGCQQPMRLVARIGLSATDRIRLTGKELSKREKDVDPIELVSRFAAFKLAPAVTIPAELIRGKTIVGEPRTPLGTAVRATIPMVYESVYEAYELEGPWRATLAGGLEFMGTSVATYKDSGWRTRLRIQRMLREENGEGAYQTFFKWNMENPDKQISYKWFRQQRQKGGIPTGAAPPGGGSIGMSLMPIMGKIAEGIKPKLEKLGEWAKEKFDISLRKLPTVETSEQQKKSQVLRQAMKAISSRGEAHLVNFIRHLPMRDQVEADTILHAMVIESGHYGEEATQYFQAETNRKKILFAILDNKVTDSKVINKAIGLLKDSRNTHLRDLSREKPTSPLGWNQEWIKIYNKWISGLQKKLKGANP